MPILVVHNNNAGRAAVGLASQVGMERDRQIAEAEAIRRAQLGQQQQQLRQSSGDRSFQQALAQQNLDLERQRLAMQGQQFDATDAYRNASLDQRGDLASQRDQTQRYGIEARASTRLKAEAMEGEQLAKRLEAQGRRDEARLVRDEARIKAQHANRLELEEMRQGGMDRRQTTKLAALQKADELELAAKTTHQGNAMALQQLGMKLRAAATKLHHLQKLQAQSFGMDPLLEKDMDTAEYEVNSIMGQMERFQPAAMPMPAPPTVNANPVPTTQPAASPVAAAPTTMPTVPATPAAEDVILTTNPTNANPRGLPYGGETLSKEQAAFYFQRAGGNKNLARQLALADGFQF